MSLPGYDAWKLASPPEADSCCGHPAHEGACRALDEGAPCPGFATCQGVLGVRVVWSIFGQFRVLECDSCHVRHWRPCPCVTCDVCGAVDGHKRGCVGI